MSQPSIMAANPFLRLVLTGRALGGASGLQARTLSTTATVNRFFWPAGQQPRFYGATTTASLAAYRTAITASSIRFASQQRTMATSGSISGSISRNLLESREAAANRNPSSASAQNAFYQVLLKANMPMIVIERYGSGRFAANEGTTEAYHRALGMVSAAPNAAAAFSDGTVGGGAGTGIAANNTNLTTAQLQAVGQAIAAQNRGATVAVGKGAQGTGAKDAPIHVVVDQPISDVLFRWVKFVLWFCLFTYFSLVVITMLIEGLNTFKRPTGRADNEVKAEAQKTRFTDVHGCDEAKEELQELVDFLKNPSGFSTLGGKLPKGILLVGPPGTGKTLLARAVAGEAGVPFFYMSGSEFDEVYVGVGAKRVRELFTSARAKSPAIVFIDELDAIGSRRNSRDAAYVKQTLNQLLTELDGFEQNSGVIILAATNFPELLDKALTRPGRFDRLVQVDLPDVRGRLAILQHHALKIKSAKDVDLQSIALQTSGLSGAELESIVNQAAIHASKAKSLAVSKTDYDWAKDKVIMGAERKSMVISPKEKELTAYHEAGHALVSYFSPASPNKLYKVTVLPRGGSLGHTSMLPEMDKYSYSVKDFLAMIDVSLGGKLAEEIKYGNDLVTGGASSVSWGCGRAGALGVESWAESWAESFLPKEKKWPLTSETGPGARDVDCVPDGDTAGHVGEGGPDAAVEPVRQAELGDEGGDRVGGAEDADGGVRAVAAAAAVEAEGAGPAGGGAAAVRDAGQGRGAQGDLGPEADGPDSGAGGSDAGAQAGQPGRRRACGSGRRGQQGAATDTARGPLKKGGRKERGSSEDENGLQG